MDVKEQTALCRVCKEDIRRGAMKCIHCDSFQDWRRYATLSSTVLSLLVALVSVLALGVPLLASSLKSENADVIVSIINAKPDHLRYGTEILETLNLTLFVTNGGKTPGAIKSISLRPKEEKMWSYHFVLREKLSEDNPVSVAFNNSIIEPGKSHLIDAHYALRKDYESVNDFVLRLEIIRFDGSIRQLHVNYPDSK